MIPIRPTLSPVLAEQNKATLTTSAPTSLGNDRITRLSVDCIPIQQRNTPPQTTVTEIKKPNGCSRSYWKVHIIFFTLSTGAVIWGATTQSTTRMQYVIGVQCVWLLLCVCLGVAGHKLRTERIKQMNGIR